jgi:ribonuclease HI
MNSIDIYTDGSCDTLRCVGAWASIIVSATGQETLTGHALNTTHQRMELVAVIESLAHLLDAGPIEMPLKLYTDSQYIADLPSRRSRLEATSFITTKGKLLPNVDLLKVFYNQCAKLPLTIVKLKAHQNAGPGENLNRKVDMMCRRLVREQIALQDL